MLESRLLSNPLHNSPRLPDLYSQFANKIAIGEKIKSIKKEIATALSVIQMDELKCRKRVLRRIGFIDDADVVQLKARVACEISTGDELVLSELLFNRFFNELTPEQCAACLSCFIFEEKTSEVPALKEELAKPYREIQQQARVIAKISQESKLQVDEDQYLKSFKYELMEVVYAWSKGASFAQIWYVYSPRPLPSDETNDTQQNDRRVRRQSDSPVQTTGRTASTGCASSQGHGQRGARAEVHGSARPRQA